MSTPSFGPQARIGIAGLGSMGAGIAHNLLKKGYPLRVFARRSDAAAPFIAAGAQAFPSAAAMARECDLVILSLSDAAAVEAVLFGDEGLAHGLRESCVVIDTSTIAAAAARRFGERLQGQGVIFIDAPVSGGQAGAQTGTLGCMVGGPAEAIDACREVLGAFCKSVTRVGDLGAGQTVKACNQVAVAGALLGVADAMALARAQGVDPALMREVLLGGTGRSFSLENHGPRIIEGKFKPGFRAALMRKDLRIALDTARAAGAVLPAATLAEQLLDALCEGGRADWDWSAMALEVQKLSGMAVPADKEP
ncbi:NAD(P)-dependent oxidoreductase [Caenimonas terrae]|uniref:NAD(P)-dependent oxidoreductase n=1 Tax=Caenimonas terrae TaxID=696074 RepID=A0ABW0NG44_9BURK